MQVKPKTGRIPSQDTKIHSFNKKLHPRLELGTSALGVLRATIAPEKQYRICDKKILNEDAKTRGPSRPLLIYIYRIQILTLTAEPVYVNSGEH